MERSTLLIGISLAAVACVQAGGVEAPTALEPIQRLIAGAACRESSQCRVIGIGAAACGGPEGYLAWSALATDERPLQDAVAAQAAARRSENERLGRMSTCMVLPVPGVRCEPAPQPAAGGLAAAGRCVLLPGSGVQSPAVR